MKLYRAGTVVGGAGSHVAMLSRHPDSVETCSDALDPGEIPFVCATVHTSSEVGGLTRG